MTFSLPKSKNSAAVEEIERRSHHLDEPKSYWIGRTFPQPIQPQNIIVFRRTDRAALQFGSAFRHQHHRYVLITAVHDSGLIGVDTHIYPIRQGQSLLVLPFQAHWYIDQASPSIHWIFVTFEHEKDARLEALRGRGAVRAPRGDLEPLRDFLRAWQTPEEQEMVRSQLGLWLHALSERTGRKKEPTEALPAEIEGGEWISEINRYVFENREQTLSLAQIARRLRVSESLLRSRFHRLTGKSVGRYVRELKLQYACELLHDTRLSITEVAERCGYDSVFSFSRAFHKTYAFSPTTYRKTHRIGG